VDEQRDLKTIRTQLLQLRRDQHPQVRVKHSLEITERAVKWFANCPLQGAAAVYRPFPDEVDLDPLFRHFQHSGLKLYFAKTLSRQPAEMDWYAADPFMPGDWEPGIFGHLEPKVNSARALTDFKNLSLVLVPGVAFSASGERIGMGLGFYDRFLERYQGPLRVSLAFDFQYCEKLPQNPWDQKTDLLLTESRTVETPRVAEKLRKLRKHL
jgi:5-formyltetrahydrofolate cyclo-ligase